MLRQMRRSVEDIRKDSPCIGVCTLNAEDICIGCHRHIEDIMKMGDDGILWDIAENNKKGQ